MPKPNIGIYIHRYNYPAATFILRQIIGIKSAFEPTVITSNKSVIKGERPNYKIIEKEKTLIERLYRFFRKITGSYALLSSSQKKFFRTIITENNFKLIHAHYGPSGIEILPLTRELNIPLIVSFHGYDASHLLRNKRYFRQLQELFKGAYIIAVSNYMAKNLVDIGANPKKISVIYYGVSVENKFVKRKPLFEKTKNNEEIKFLQISNFIEKKGHIYTLKAFNEFLNYYPNCKLTLGGNGLLLEEVKRLVYELNLQEKVLFLGFIKPNEVFDVMMTADIFLHHSIMAKTGDKEGIPNVIIEAMATGLPVISTYHSGIPELIDDEKDGFLVEEKNIDMYVKKIKIALKSDEQISINARKKVLDKFNLEKQNQKIIDLYKSINK